MSEFKGTTDRRDDAARATAHLPGLDIEIVHRRSPDGESEHLSINLQAVPSFEAFARYLEAANPLVFWAAAARLAWLPWLEAGRTALLPFTQAPALLDPHRPHRER